MQRLNPDTEIPQLVETDLHPKINQQIQALGDSDYVSWCKEWFESLKVTNSDHPIDARESNWPSNMRRPSRCWGAGQAVRRVAQTLIAASSVRADPPYHRPSLVTVTWLAKFAKVRSRPVMGLIAGLAITGIVFVIIQQRRT